MKPDLVLPVSLKQPAEKGKSVTNYRNYADSSKDDLTIQRKILICNACYWSTSVIISDNEIGSCPVCHNCDLETIPIGINECYTYYYDLKKGLVLHFTKLQQVNNGHR